jgi:hypothetical protein
MPDDRMSEVGVAVTVSGKGRKVGLDFEPVQNLRAVHANETEFCHLFSVL